ncbi:MAG TPA: CPBP family intramembrane glutamic endopeptidase [Candidatus Limnocylindrales bacterium]|nr:CPBP family intramembrane glutamic endopeptidase [Candidatus Limnocylindrales bacterium]
MTAIALRSPGRVGRPALIVAGLAGVVGLRWAATVTGFTGPVAIGGGFGIALLGVVVASGWRPAPIHRPSTLVGLAVGLAGGAVLVVLAIATRSDRLPWLAPAAAFGPWAVATVLVATAEELVLRGALLDALEGSVGTGSAVLITSVAFALMHVPLYGWHVVPLDLGVGLWLAGLRLGTGGVVAPAVAHAIADLATWWL